MSKAILTLPMMPVDGNNYGKFVTPIICETLKNIFDCNYYHCINVLDSFNDRRVMIDGYISSLKNNNIHYDKLWYDIENIPKLLENIKRLIKNGYIFELNSSIYRCDCGIVEIEKNKISTCNPNNLKFIYNNGKLMCKHCGGICKEYNEKVLAFLPKGIELKDINILPRYLNKDIKTFEQTILKSYTTISRNRNTGISICYNGTNYNIDIDFLWGTYLNTFSEKEKIVVSGNRMIYQLFLVSVLEKCLCPENNTILLGTPYITNIKNILHDSRFINNSQLRKLFVLFNTKWQKKEILYDETILTYLNKMSVEKRSQLYDIINTSLKDGSDFYNDAETILKKHLNMQEAIKKLKLERR